jgi:hypothetical protein
MSSDEKEVMPNAAEESLPRTAHGGHVAQPPSDKPGAALDSLLAKARGIYDAMTLEQKAEHDRKQRDSWVRGEMGMGESVAISHAEDDDVADLVRSLERASLSDDYPLTISEYRNLCGRAAVKIRSQATEIARCHARLETFIDGCLRHAALAKGSKG